MLSTASAAENTHQNKNKNRISPQKNKKTVKRGILDIEDEHVEKSLKGKIWAWVTLSMLLLRLPSV